MRPGNDRWEPLYGNEQAVRAALSYIPAHDRDTWVRMAYAVKHGLGESGKDIWESWSQTAENYDRKAALAVWRSVKNPTGSVSLSTLFWEASRHGFDPAHELGAIAVNPQELERRRAERASRDATEAAKLKARQASAARTAVDVWTVSTPAGADHPYLARKGVAPTSTLREIDAADLKRVAGYAPKSDGVPLQGRVLVAPVKVDGLVSTIEFIDGSGRKSALSNGVKSGGYWASGPLGDAVSAGRPILIGEGVATVGTARDATGGTAVAALTCYNLPKVAKAIRRQYPDADLVILADRGNGQKDAERAARETGARLAVPEFGPDEWIDSQRPTDFNDLGRLRGHAAVAQAVAQARPLDAELAPALPQRVEIRDHADNVLYARESAPSVAAAVESAVAEGVSLKGAALAKTNLDDTNLAGADLAYADLREVSLRNADLQRSSLRGADMSGANLSGTELDGADLEGTNLTGISRDSVMREDVVHVQSGSADFGTEMVNVKGGSKDWNDRLKAMREVIDERTERREALPDHLRDAAVMLLEGPGFDFALQDRPGSMWAALKAVEALTKHDRLIEPYAVNPFRESRLRDMYDIGRAKRGPDVATVSDSSANRDGAGLSRPSVPGGGRPVDKVKESEMSDVTKEKAEKPARSKKAAPEKVQQAPTQAPAAVVPAPAAPAPQEKPAPEQPAATGRREAGAHLYDLKDVPTEIKAAAQQRFGMDLRMGTPRENATYRGEAYNTDRYLVQEVAPRSVVFHKKEGMEFVDNRLKWCNENQKLNGADITVGYDADKAKVFPYDRQRDQFEKAVASLKKSSKELGLGEDFDKKLDQAKEASWDRVKEARKTALEAAKERRAQAQPASPTQAGPDR
ncbi:pentapeptide repeat-containing protein [Burkholderia pyrrocinia]|uniref:pentapeptide repeat-containing protein n=1 Tax=Burkholderia pyrrocinia TaxID=60550 RepID=UPI001BCC9457|nr:pentapeptide repeat-containing protein [Burkholderia pyrrocinia]QVN18990.1 pentapeptide repeat-containing protein [Burkholderia pyrrocinia]